MKANNLLIGIEGVDGVGKTTTAKLLSEKMHAHYQKTPLSSLKQIARLLDKFHNPEIETIGYFLLTIITSLSILWRLKHQSVICDKYILNTIVTQTCLGGRLTKLMEKIRYLLVKKPDFTFCLTIKDKELLVKRLKQRGKLDENDQQLLPYWFRIQEEYGRFAEVVYIDTTDKKPRNIISLIFNYLKI